MKRAELRAKLAQARAAFRARLRKRMSRAENNPALKAARARQAKSRTARRRRALLAALALLLLLFLLSQCECDEPVSMATDAGAPADAGPRAKKESIEQKRPRPFKGKTKPTERSGMKVDPRGPPNWLPRFRLQVAARSTQLATCFTNSEQPGAMRWTTSVNVLAGTVSDSTVEPVFKGAGLDGPQRDCLLAVLAKQPYALSDADTDPDDTRRVSIIFEF